MTIYYTRGFKEVLNNPSRYIKISKFRAISETLLENYKGLSSEDLNIPFSPTGGYYDSEGIIQDNLLTLSIEIPSSDVSINDYTALLFFYDDVLNSNEYPQLAFILSGSISLDDKNSESMILGKLDLENRTIINIPNFNHRCSICLSQTDDLKFLEGKGLGKISSLYLNIDESEKPLRYVSIDSYEAYLLELRGMDDSNHSYTTYINNYGLKVY